MSDAQIDAAKDAALNILLGNCGSARTVEGEPWTQTLTHAEPSLTVYYAPGPPGSSNNRFKGVCDLPHPPDLVWDCLHDNDRRHMWDRNISGIKWLPLREGPRITAASPPVSAGIVHSSTRNVGIISGRDFVDLPVFMAFSEAPSKPAGLDSFVAPTGTLVSGGAGVVDARFPEVQGFVRGWNSPGSGWVLEPIEHASAPNSQGTRIHYLIHTDLKGWILPLLVNSSLAVRASLFFSFTCGWAPPLPTQLYATQAHTHTDCPPTHPRFSPLDLQQSYVVFFTDLAGECKSRLGGVLSAEPLYTSSANSVSLLG